MYQEWEKRNVSLLLVENKNIFIPLAPLIHPTFLPPDPVQLIAVQRKMRGDTHPMGKSNHLLSRKAKEKENYKKHSASQQDWELWRSPLYVTFVGAKRWRRRRRNVSLSLDNAYINTHVDDRNERRRTRMQSARAPKCHCYLALYYNREGECDGWWHFFFIITRMWEMFWATQKRGGMNSEYLQKSPLSAEKSCQSRVNINESFI